MQKRSQVQKSTEVEQAPKPEENAFIKDAEEKATKEVARKERETARLNGDIGPNVFPSGDEGEEVTVTMGESAYSPKQYNTFRVGPFSSTTKVRAGETRNDAARRVMKQLAVLEREEFDRKLDTFRKCFPEMFREVVS